jgi:hypothetical protein
MDWSKIKFRASSWGALMTEPREKAAKDRGELSKSCQKELFKIYNLEKYGRKKDIVTKQMTKGTLVEPESIALLNKVEGKEYIKNEEQLSNEWFTGHPDIFIGEDIRKAKEVHDIKSSWELDTFTPKLVEEIDDAYNNQLQVYFDLTGSKEGSITYCLVNAPDMIIQNEMKNLLYNMNVISEESPEYRLAAAELLNNMVFDDIDYRERVIKQIVYRDDELIAKMKSKVPVLRKYLAYIESLHIQGREQPAPPIDISTIPLIKIK